MKNIIIAIIGIAISGCGPNFHLKNLNDLDSPETPVVDPVTYFPVASATITVSSYGQFATYERPLMMNLLVPQALAQVGQGSATITVSYNNPSSTVFTVNTSALGSSVTTVGDDLNLGSVTVSGLDDNTLRVCTGVGAPQNRCNRLIIRVFTLGTATGGITGTAGFINRDGLYGIDVFAGTVTTPIGFNPSPIAGVVTNAASVYTFSFSNNVNRIRLSQLSIPSIPIKADLTNAGNGQYEMNLVVQYALAYVP